MDFKSEMREAIENMLHNIGEKEFGYDAMQTDMKDYIDTALSSLLALIEKRMPKKKEWDYFKHDSEKEYEFKGFNQCLSEIRKEFGDMSIFDPYLHFNKLSEVNRKVLESYWGRKNRFAMVKFSDDNILVFLVSDDKKPQIPGYPATAIERFKSHKEAEEEIKRCYKNLDYTPENAEYGTWSR